MHKEKLRTHDVFFVQFTNLNLKQILSILDHGLHLVDPEVGGALLDHLALHVHLDQARGCDLVVHHPWKPKKHDEYYSKVM